MYYVQENTAKMLKVDTGETNIWPLKTVSSANSTGETGYQPTEEWKWNFISHLTPILTPNALRISTYDRYNLHPYVLVSLV